MDRLLGLVLCLVVVAAACAGPEQTDDATPVTPEDPPPTEAARESAVDPETGPRHETEPADDPTPVVPPQLDFRLPEVTGGEVVGAELAGRAVALWFWAPW